MITTTDISGTTSGAWIGADNAMAKRKRTYNNLKILHRKLKI
jgi:hypothetical protein